MVSKKRKMFLVNAYFGNANKSSFSLLIIQIIKEFIMREKNICIKNLYTFISAVSS